MSDLLSIVKIITERVDKGSINEKTLYDILITDSDFIHNEDFFREDTIELGYENEADRVSKEIFYETFSIEDESERLKEMVNKLFSIDNFIGNSEDYGDFKYKIIETDFEYIIIIGTII